MIDRRMQLRGNARANVPAPLPEDIATLRLAARKVERQEISARTVARLAVSVGLLLIGTTVPQKKHHPVDAIEHRYGDLRDGKKIKQYVTPEARLLQVGSNVDIALLCGLFGDMNCGAQEAERCMPITGREYCNFGWGTDTYKTYRQGLFDYEEAHVRPHARPELINAALDQDNPLTGFIDCVYDSGNTIRVPHDLGQYLTPDSRRTVIRIPLIGYLDLPIDIVSTHYEDFSSMALSV